MTPSQQDTDPRLEKLLSKLSDLDPSISEAGGNRFEESVKKGSSSTPALMTALEDKDDSVRADSAEALGRLKAKGAVSKLKDLLNDDSADVRQAAAIALIKIGNDTILGEVTKNLRDEDPAIIAHAAVTLGKVCDPRVVPNLLEAFSTDDPYIGSAIAWALGQIGDSRAVEWLVAAMENVFIPANSAEALGRIGDATAVPALLRALNLPNDDARAYAARALGMIREPVGLKGVRAHTWLEKKEAMIDALKGCLQDRSHKVRVFAAVALYELGVKSAGQTLLDLLEA